MRSRPHPVRGDGRHEESAGNEQNVCGALASVVAPPFGRVNVHREGIRPPAHFIPPGDVGGAVVLLVPGADSHLRRGPDGEEAPVLPAHLQRPFPDADSIGDAGDRKPRGNLALDGEPHRDDEVNHPREDGRTVRILPELVEGPEPLVDPGEDIGGSDAREPCAHVLRGHLPSSRLTNHQALEEGPDGGGGSGLREPNRLNHARELLDARAGDERGDGRQVLRTREAEGLAQLPPGLLLLGGGEHGEGRDMELAGVIGHGAP
jgi:hypothetical protein